MSDDWGGRVERGFPLEQMQRERQAFRNKWRLRMDATLMFGVGFAIGAFIGWLVFGI